MTQVGYIVGILELILIVGLYGHSLYIMIRAYNTGKKTKQMEYKILLTVASVVIVLMSILYLKMDIYSVLLIEIPFVAFVVIDINKKFDGTEILKDNTSMYKKMAYSDALTSLGNRYAFDECARNVPLQNVCIISFDVNNLKYHNDTYGHFVGDKLLVNAGKVITKIYGPNVFRCGGDEFIVLSENETIESLEKKRKSLQKLCLLYNAKSDKIKLDIACGYAIYCNEDRSVTDIVERADKEMYENKRMLKGECQSNLHI